MSTLERLAFFAEWFVLSLLLCAVSDWLAARVPPLRRRFVGWTHGGIISTHGEVE